MTHSSPRVLRGLLVAASCLLLVVLASPAAAQTLGGACQVPDNGTGTVTLPPAGCGYLSPSQFHAIIAGLPAGTTIIIDPIHWHFICRSGGTCETPGGPLGGNIETFNSTVTLQLSGTGALSGWTHTITVPAQVRTFTAPRTAGAAVQSFATEMDLIQTAVHSDSEFSSFQIVGGTANGYPSPGHTTLTKIGGGLFDVDSKFNVGYSIRFQGAPGSALKGLEGVSEGTVEMHAAGDKDSNDQPVDATASR